jgi:Flp pilus assembly protein TadB
VGEDEKTPEEKAEELPRSKGKGTLIFEATAIAEEKAAKRRAKEVDRDREQEARLDRANSATLEQANRRAEDAIKELDRKDKNWKEAMAGKDKQIKFQWFIIALLVAALLVAVFDKTVGFDWTKGTVNAGSDPIEKGP